LNHNYEYWYELFNERQLLCLDILLRAIIELKDENVREFMITLFSSCLEFNNMFCSYKGTSRVKPGAVRHIFSHHAFVLPREPLENNLWGVNNSSGSFSSLYRSRLRRGKEYCLAPMERLVKDGRVVQKVRIKGEKIEGQLATSFVELQAGRKNALLLCQNSEALDLPDKSVDAIIVEQNHPHVFQKTGDGLHCRPNWTKNAAQRGVRPHRSGQDDRAHQQPEMTGPSGLSVFR